MRLYIKKVNPRIISHTGENTPIQINKSSKPSKKPDNPLKADLIVFSGFQFLSYIGLLSIKGKSEIEINLVEEVLSM